MRMVIFSLAFFSVALVGCGSGEPSTGEVAASLQSAVEVKQGAWDVKKVTCVKATGQSRDCVVRFDLPSAGFVGGSRAFRVTLDDSNCWKGKTTEHDGSLTISVSGCID